jgi:hypothetical protein
MAVPPPRRIWLSATAPVLAATGTSGPNGVPACGWHYWHPPEAAPRGPLGASRTAPQLQHETSSPIAESHKVRHHTEVVGAQGLAGHSELWPHDCSVGKQALHSSLICCPQKTAPEKGRLSAALLYTGICCAGGLFQGQPGT